MAKDKIPVGKVLKWLWAEPWFQRALLLAAEWAGKKLISSIQNRKKKLDKSKDNGTT